MESPREEGNGYVVLNGMKGIWTLDEVIKLLQSYDIKIKVSMTTKDDIRQSHESSNLVEKKEVR